MSIFDAPVREMPLNFPQELTKEPGKFFNTFILIQEHRQEKAISLMQPKCQKVVDISRA